MAWFHLFLWRWIPGFGWQKTAESGNELLSETAAARAFATWVEDWRWVHDGKSYEIAQQQRYDPATRSWRVIRSEWL